MPQLNERCRVPGETIPGTGCRLSTRPLVAWRQTGLLELLLAHLLDTSQRRQDISCALRAAFFISENRRRLGPFRRRQKIDAPADHVRFSVPWRAQQFLSVTRFLQKRPDFLDALGRPLGFGIEL